MAKTIIVTPVAPPAPTPLQQAQAALANLLALAATADWSSGILSTNVDGQSVTFRSMAELNESIQFWQRQVGLLSGARRRTATICL